MGMVAKMVERAERTAAQAMARKPGIINTAKDYIIKRDSIEE
jgi:hypothetical protein